MPTKKVSHGLIKCRIPYQSEDELWKPNRAEDIRGGNLISPETKYLDRMKYPDDKGRFPANLLVEDDVLNNGEITKSQRSERGLMVDIRNNSYDSSGKKLPDSTGIRGYNDSGSFSRYFSLDAWTEKTLPFLIVPKAAKAEKGNACTHPTVKPLKLMSYLITMGSREGDTILDPFCGSGTVLIAARQLARDFVGIEINDEYVQIARTRVRPYLEQTRLL